MVLILAGVTEVNLAVADLSSTELRKVLAYAARGGAGGGGEQDAATAATKDPGGARPDGAAGGGRALARSTDVRRLDYKHL